MRESQPIILGEEAYMDLYGMTAINHMLITGLPLLKEKWESEISRFNCMNGGYQWWAFTRALLSQPIELVELDSMFEVVN